MPVNFPAVDRDKEDLLADTVVVPMFCAMRRRRSCFPVVGHPGRSPMREVNGVHPLACV